MQAANAALVFIWFIASVSRSQIAARSYAGNKKLLPSDKSPAKTSEAAYLIIVSLPAFTAISWKCIKTEKYYKATILPGCQPEEAAPF